MRKAGSTLSQGWAVASTPFVQQQPKLYTFNYARTRTGLPHHPRAPSCRPVFPQPRLIHIPTSHDAPSAPPHVHHLHCGPACTPPHIPTPRDACAPQAGMYAIRARRKTVTEKDFLEAVNKVIKGYQKFSATPKYMVGVMGPRRVQTGEGGRGCCTGLEGAAMVLLRALWQEEGFLTAARHSATPNPLLDILGLERRSGLGRENRWLVPDVQSPRK